MQDENITKSRLFRLYNKTIKDDTVVIIKNGEIETIKPIGKIMSIKKFFYGSKKRRVIMRFIEIFILGGIVTLFANPEFNDVIQALPPLYIGILAAITKAAREFLEKK